MVARRSQPDRLGQLPVELLELILEKLPKVDCLSLRRTCRYLKAHLSPSLFEMIRLELSYEPHRSLLAAASIGIFPAIAEYIQTVEVSLVYPPDLGDEDMVVRHFVCFLKKLQNLQCFRWEYCSSNLQNPNGCVQEVMSTIAEIPTLQEVKVVLYVTSTGLPVSGFKNLTSLSVMPRAPYTTQILDHLKSTVTPAVTASPKLKELIIHNPVRNDTRGMGAWLSEIGTPPVQHLTLEGIPIISSPLPVEFCSILSNLKGLTLNGEFYRIRWKALWNSLHNAGLREGVRLETLGASGEQEPDGMKAMFNYLLFHPGLKGLTISNPPYHKFREDKLAPKRIENKRFATQFWRDVVPHHSHSLRELRVASLRSGPWTYGPAVSTVLRECTLLKELEISLSHVDAEWASKKAAQLVLKAGSPGPGPLFQTTSLRPNNIPPSYMDNYIKPTGTPPWGKIQTMPLILCTDLALLPNVESVQIVFAVKDLGGSRRRGTPFTTLLQEVVCYAAKDLLNRYVVREDPHRQRFCAEGGILRLDPLHM